MTDITGTSGSDTLTGSDSDDVIYGLAGDDVIEGAGGNDKIFGGSGSDTLSGGDDDDTFVFENIHFYGTTVDGGDGRDVLDLSAVTSDVSNSYGTGSDGSGDVFSIFGNRSGAFRIETVANVEVVKTGSGADDLVFQARTAPIEAWAGAGDDRVTANTRGLLDVVFGESGNDTIMVYGEAYGGEGDDRVYNARLSDGGSGHDLLGLDSMISVDLATGTGVSEDLGDITFQNFEYYVLSGNNYAPQVTGTDASDKIEVYGGSPFYAPKTSLVDGKGGDDDLSGDGNIYGGNGNDILRPTGGRFAATIDGGDGTDTLSLAHRSVAVTVDLGSTFEVYTLRNIENIEGTAGNDTLSGSDGSNRLSGGAGQDHLDGKAGADILIGGAGNDRYVVDDLGDVVEEAAGQGTDEVRTALSTYSLAANVENLVGVSLHGQRLTGNERKNSLTGSVDNDELHGEAGDDTLSGGSGDDALHGGVGNDDLHGDADNDILDGGAGTDGLYGGDGDDRIVYDATDNFANMSGGTGNDVLVIWNMQAPVQLNLDGAGFEAAEIITPDMADAAWSSLTNIYNGNWALVQQTTSYDAGGRLVVQLDPANVASTAQVWSVFDGLNRLASVDTIFDNGSRTFINLDEDGTKEWSADWFNFDAEGRLDSEDVIYDGGSHTFINFDQANTANWAQDWFSYDALGRLDSEDVVYDNGSRTFINLDQDNSASWSSAWFTYDAQGRLDTQDVNNDDGSRTFTNYDQAGTEPFQLTAMVYNGSGALTEQVVVWDDGSTSYTYF